MDAQQRYQFNSAGYEAWFGTAPAELKGRRLRDVLGEKGYEAVKPYVEAVLRGRQVRYEGELVLPNGRACFANIDYIPDIAPGGDVRGYYVAVTDVTERLRMEGALQESETQLRRVLNSLYTFVGVLTPDGVVVELNRAPLEAVGITFDDVYGRPFEDTYWWSYSPEVQAQLRDAINRAARGESSRYDVDVRTAGDRIANIDFMIVPLRDAEGHITHLIPSGVDVTERKRADMLLQEQLHFLQTLLDAIPSPIFYKNADGTYLGCNEAFQAYLGLSKEQILGKDVYGLAPKHLADRYWKADRELLETGGVQTYEASVVYADGTHHDVIFHKATFPKADGSAGGVVGTIVDITDRRRVEDALQRSEAEYRALFELSAVGLAQSDCKTGQLLRANAKYCEILGYPREELLSRNFREITHPDDVAPNVMLHEQLLRGNIRDYSMEKRYIRKDGQPVWVNLTATVLRGPDGSPLHALGVIQDITGRKRAEEELAYQAQHDALTGLPNRTLLRDRLQQALSYAHRHGGQVGVLFLDLDQFKVVNDSLGHEVGDRFLLTIAQRVQECVREADTLARYGGDELVIVMPDVECPEDISRLAERVLAAISQPIAIDGQELHSTASAGASLFPRDGGDPTVLLRNADTAMYRAKEMGRNNLQFYTEELNARVTQRLVMSRELHRAIEREELLLHFQPQVELSSGRICGLEALVRWQHPELGMVSPAQFIPLAEELGLIVPLGEWVLRQACAQAKAWQDAGLPKIAVAVNLSARELERPDIVAVVAKALRDTGLAPGYLELELTESAMVGRPEETAAQLHALKALGVMLAVDDFGTGYSSLAHLKRYPFDKLKIDRSFVHDVTRDPDAASIALTIVAMARGLRLRTVAEGVETAAQLSFLRRHGCHEMQGYYFSAPVPACEIEQLLRNTRALAFSREDSGRPTLLLADNDIGVINALQQTLHRGGYRVLTATSAHDAFDLLATHEVQVLISGPRVADMNSITFLSHVKELYPDTMRIVLSGDADIRTVTDAVNRGAIYKLLPNPWVDEELTAEVAAAIGEYRRRMDRPTPAATT